MIMQFVLIENKWALLLFVRSIEKSNIEIILHTTVGVVMPSSVVEGSKIEVGPVVEGLNGIVYVDVVTVLNKDDGTTGVLVEDGLP